MHRRADHRLSFIPLWNAHHSSISLVTSGSTSIIRVNAVRENPIRTAASRLMENIMLAHIIEKISNWFQFAESPTEGYSPSSTTIDDPSPPLRPLKFP